MYVVRTVVLPRINAYSGPRSILVIDNGSAHNKHVSYLILSIWRFSQRFFSLFDTEFYNRNCRNSPILSAYKSLCFFFTFLIIILSKKRFMRLKLLFAAMQKWRKCLAQILKVFYDRRSNIS
jgi:hypothetical protein